MRRPQSGCIQRFPSVWGSVFCRLQIAAVAAALPRSRAQRTALGLRDRLRPRLRPQPMRRRILGLRSFRLSRLRGSFAVDWALVGALERTRGPGGLAREGAEAERCILDCRVRAW